MYKDSKMSKKNIANYANIVFLACVVVSILAHIFVSIIELSGAGIPIVMNLLISQLIILLPALVVYIFANKNGEIIVPFKKIKLVNVLLMVIFTWLIGPLTIVANLFSQFFTKNEVVGISSEVTGMPIWLMVLVIGIVGPANEEFVFRGIIYRGLSIRSHRYIASAILSGLFFGLMHMNFNQFCYAFVLGIIFAFINEVLDSTWPSFICHAVINTQNVLLVYVTNWILSEYAGTNLSEAYTTQGQTTQMKGIMVVMFGVMLIVAVASTSLAALLFYGICKIEGKENRIKEILSKDKKERAEGQDSNEETENASERNRYIIYPAGMIAIGLCIFVMFFLEPLIELLK